MGPSESSGSTPGHGVRGDLLGVQGDILEVGHHGVAPRIDFPGGNGGGLESLMELGRESCIGNMKNVRRELKEEGLFENRWTVTCDLGVRCGELVPRRFCLELRHYESCLGGHHPG